MVVYGDVEAGLGNLLVDVKGRRVGKGRGPLATGRLETWVTEEDVRSLGRWEQIFCGAGGGAAEGMAGGVAGRDDRFRAAFVFVYWCDEQPPDALFQEVFEFRGRWYALRVVLLHDYAAAMKPRSSRWRTVHVPRREFERLSSPFSSVGADHRRPSPRSAPSSPPFSPPPQFPHPERPNHPSSAPPSSPLQPERLPLGSHA